MDPPTECDTYRLTGECKNITCKLLHSPSGPNILMQCHVHEYCYSDATVFTEYYSKDGINYYSDKQLTKLIFIWNVKGRFASRVNVDRFKLTGNFENRHIYSKCFLYYSKAKLHYNRYVVLKQFFEVNDVAKIILTFLLDPINKSKQVIEAKASTR